MRVRCLLFPMWLATVVLSLNATAQPVGPEFQVNTYTTSSQDGPSVASDANGNFVVVWQSRYQDLSFVSVFGQRFDSSGNPLGTEFQVNTFTTENQRYSSVASDSSGNFVVVWGGYGEEDYYGIVGQRFDNGGNRLGGAFQVNTYTTSSQKEPSVASDATGNFVVVWDSYSQDGSQGGVFGQRFDHNGKPLGKEFQVNRNSIYWQVRSSVASDAIGDFVVVWSNFYYGPETRSYGIFGQRYDKRGTRLGDEFQVNTYTGGKQQFPRVASDATGNFVVVWTNSSHDGSSYGVFGQRYDSDGRRLGGEFPVNTYTTGVQYQPTVTSDANGNFVVLWSSAYDQDGNSDGVFGQRFDNEGNPVGREFQVNTYTTNSQRHASVASDASGSFVVAWQSDGQDGSGDGIFGQRFADQGHRLGCDDIRAVRVRCHGGDLQVGFALADNSHDGETLTLRVNDHDRILTIQGDRAKASGPGQGLNTCC